MMPPPEEGSAGDAVGDDPTADCGVCEGPAVVTLRIEWADSVDMHPVCMDCAADIVGAGLAEIVEAPR